MQTIKTISELKQTLNELRKKENSIGYVPTMGALHEGHASLIKNSVANNSITVVSVFVNPTQFLAGEDLEKYPHNQPGDEKLCELCGADIVFMPNADEMYTQEEPLILAPKALSTILEGAIRPGHFDGVLRVLNKFFNIIKPNNVYFGKKDAQQLIIVKNMIDSFFMDITLNPCDIVRSADGLALSSRNSYLDEEEKLSALKISRSLLKASNLVQSGELNSLKIKTAMKEILEPLEVDYIAVVDRNLKEIENVKLSNTIILVAARIGKTRLIDNIWI